MIEAIHQDKHSILKLGRDPSSNLEHLRQLSKESTVL
jgi:hypothetical protein